MKTGTCYFPSYGAALRYYRPYCCAREYRRGDRTQVTRAVVDEKLNAGEIRIGKPPTQPGDTLSIEDNRWHITEAEQLCPRCSVAASQRIPGNALRCLNCGAEWNTEGEK